MLWLTNCIGLIAYLMTICALLGLVVAVGIASDVDNLNSL